MCIYILCILLYVCASRGLFSENAINSSANGAPPPHHTTSKDSVRVPSLRRRFDEAVQFINPTAQRVPRLQQRCILFMYVSYIVIIYSKDDTRFQSQILRFQKQIYIMLLVTYLWRIGVLLRGKYNFYWIFVEVKNRCPKALRVTIEILL